MVKEELSKLEILKTATQALALPFKEQISLFPEFVHITDELLLNFDDVFLFINEFLEKNLLTQGQIKFFREIDNFSIFLTKQCYKITPKEVLRTDIQWEKMRDLAKKALIAMNWSLEPPRLSHLTYLSSDRKSRPK